MTESIRATGMQVDNIEARTYQVLGNLIDSKYDVLRLGAVQALGYLSGSGSVEILTRALQDPDEDVRCDAVQALARHADKSVVPALIENLKGDPCGDVKVLVAELLGQLDAKDAAPLLRDLVVSRDANSEIAWDEDAFYEDGWDDWVDIQVKAIEALGQMGDADAVKQILIALNDEFRQELSAVACRALANMGANGFAALEQLLVDAPRRLKQAIITAIASTPGEGGVVFLRRLLTDSDPQLRLAALQNLAARDTDLSGLTGLLSDPDPVVRANAVALVQPTERQLIDVLMNDSADPVVMAALSSLRSGPRWEIDHTYSKLLIFMTEHKNMEISAAALDVMICRNGRDALPTVEQLLAAEETPGSVRWSIARGLGELSGRKSIDLLEEMIASDSREVRLQALSSLHRRADAGSRRALQVLCVAGRVPDAIVVDENPVPAVDGNATVRQELAQSGLDVRPADDGGSSSTLGAILGDEDMAGKWMQANDDGENVSPLTDEELSLLALAKRVPRRQKVSFDKDPGASTSDTCCVALRLLGSLVGGDVRRTLLEGLSSGDEETRISAADSLLRNLDRDGDLTAEQLERIGKLASSANVDLRRIGLQILAIQGAEHLKPYLAQALSDPDAVVRATAIRVSDGDSLPFEGLASLMDDASPLVRLAAAETVAASNDSRAVDELFRWCFRHGGFHTDDAAALLCRLDVAFLIERTLEILCDVNRKLDWANAMDILKPALTYRSVH